MASFTPGIFRIEKHNKENQSRIYQCEGIAGSFVSHQAEEKRYDNQYCESTD
jgi:hypothetical protein